MPTLSCCLTTLPDKFTGILTFYCPNPYLPPAVFGLAWDPGVGKWVGGSGSVVNEVQFAYNNFGQLTADYQAHSSTVNTSTSPKVQYAYANGSANTIRPTSLTYPNGRAINYSYGSADSMADALSRVAALVDSDGGSTHLADYSYLGLRTFVEVDYTEPEIKYTLVGTAGGNDPDTGDIYRGFDRFGRIKDSYWYDYGHATDVDRIKYGYDRNGNRTYRENTVAASYGKYFDEKYVHDLLDRLKHMDRGELTALKDAITNKTFAQCWSLDATGNWKKFLEDSDGDNAWDLNQTRTTNLINEITDITESVGPSWVTPVYNRAGNMTTIPKPADPTQAFTGTYDAWNRLVKLEDGSGTVAQYEYDGAKRRSVKKIYTSGTLSETRHFYYTEPSQWQVVEERVDSSSDADRQFVWGLRYVDDLVLRDRDTDADGTVDERLYGMQDANWNVVALSDTSGSIQERFSYDAYGLSTVLTGIFGSRATSTYDWEALYTGCALDTGTGFQDNRNRWYVGHLGRWLSRDPIGYQGGDVNLYRYVENSPLTHSDPTGLLLSYGNWCGPFAAGPDPPIDDLDAACEIHDNCLATWRQFLIPFRRRCCDRALCFRATMALLRGCNTSPTPLKCRVAAAIVMRIMCSGGSLVPGFPLGAPGVHLGTIPGAPWPF